MKHHNEHCTRVFRRYTEKGVCPRCDELREGAAPRAGWGNPQRSIEDQINEIKAHDCTAAQCGPVCTFGDH